VTLDAEYCPTCGTRLTDRNDSREVRGGPMWYVQKALVEPLWDRGTSFWRFLSCMFKLLAILFAAATILNSFGSGNMFQGWNVSDVLQKNYHVHKYVSATIFSILVALVIIGGIKRIGQVAAKLVPFMCVVYVLGALYVIAVHAADIPYYLSLIVRSAFTPTAEGGAFAGVSVWVAFTWGLKRACFSNEAGEGSAAMAHAAAKTEEPIREGVVAGIGPFIDTLIICTMSALVLLMSGAWNRPAAGVVASVTEDVVQVELADTLPERFKELYLDRIHAGRQLAVHTAVDAVAGGWDRVVLPVKNLVLPEGNDGEARWSQLTTLALDLEDVDAEARGELKVGQPVHLDLEGAELTRFAFDTTLKGLGAIIITTGVCLFAFSTMISWSYYGENGAEYLLGPRAILPYKFVFVVFVFLGMVLQEFKWVYNFSDATVGLMVLCNLPAVLILSPHVIRAAKNYFRRLDAGEMPRVNK
jgi:AGCS family alanine or glycine:cation symporter